MVFKVLTKSNGNFQDIININIFYFEIEPFADTYMLYNEGIAKTSSCV